MREITDDLCEELLIQILDGLLEHFPKGFLGKLVKPQNIIVGTQIDNFVRTSCAIPGENSGVAHAKTSGEILEVTTREISGRTQEHRGTSRAMPRDSVNVCEIWVRFSRFNGNLTNLQKW